MRKVLIAMLLVGITAPVAFSADMANGKKVYEKNCAMCHKSGIAGSPKLDDKNAWKDRLAQGEAVLVEHSIKGFRGKTGYMPPKGGKASLSDADVTDAVHYMISEVK